jgi:hypothetical protein
MLATKGRSMTFTASREFVEAFGLDRQTDFTEVTPFASAIGFSVQRPYPPSSAFKPPMKRDGTPDTVALVKLVYTPQRSDPATPARVPISASASVFSRYIYRHFDYNFQDSECPTEESIRDSKKSRRPIDLEAIDQFFYDHNTDTIQDSDGKTIAEIQILNELYEKHVATVDSLRGKVFHWKISAVGKASLATHPLDKFLKWSLRMFCGRTIEPPRDSFRGALEPYSLEDMKLLITESIDVFGYRASKNVIGTFCVLLLLAYIVLKFVSHVPQWLIVISNNTFLGSAACILLIGGLDHLLPACLFWLINANISTRLKFMRTKVRFG